MSGAPPVQPADHRAPRSRAAGRRCLAALAGTALLLPALAGCTSGGSDGAAGASQSVATASRERLASGGTVRWAVDQLPATLNVFQFDSDTVTDQVAGAVLPMLFTLDARGRPQLNEDYLRSAEIAETEPKQTVVYTLRPEARWSSGRRIGVADFVAQWKALNGEDNAYWTARDVGYDRIEKVTEGPGPHQVRVTFAKPYADWKSLFTPLYPESVTKDADSFNDGARLQLPAAAGPFEVADVDREDGAITLRRNDAWWGDPALLDKLVFTAVPRNERRAALATGKLHVAEVTPAVADRIVSARNSSGDHKNQRGTQRGTQRDALRNQDVMPGASAPESRGQGTAGHAAALSATHDVARARLAEDHGAGHDGGDDGGRGHSREHSAPRARLERAAEHQAATASAAERVRGSAFAAREAAETKEFRDFTVHRAYDAAYTQLALNGTSDALSDERVRRAIARAIDREALAKQVHGPAGLPARPLGSHLRTLHQDGYADNSDALGATGPAVSAELLDEAGWRAVPGGAAGPTGGENDGVGDGSAEDSGGSAGEAPAGPPAQSRFRPLTPLMSLTPFAPVAEQQAAVLQQAASAQWAEARSESDTELAKTAESTDRDADAARRRAASLAERAASVVRMKDGESLALRFLVPAAPGAEQLREVGRDIADMLAKVGVLAEIDEVGDEAAFRERVVDGDFDLALYSWPATAYPATDARPVFAKPQAIAGGELFIEQNYTRVGTDYIDQLLDDAARELDEDEHRTLVNQADARIWAAAGSIPLYQRPELVAVRSDLAGVGAYGLQTPRYQDIGFHR